MRSLSPFKPFPTDDREFLPGLYAIVGHLIVAFGLLEFGLDAMTAIAHANGGNAFRKKIPVPFSERTSFIIEAARRLRFLAAVRTRLEHIMTESDRLARIRNDVVHGYIAEYDREADHLLTFAKATVKKSTPAIHRIVLRRIAAADLAESVVQVTDISEELATINNRLLGLPLPTRRSA